MRPIYVTKTLAAASANNIAQSQTPLAAGNLTLNGSAVASGVATLDTQRQVIITSAGNDTGRTFTIYGTNDNGDSISEAVTGASGGAAASTLNFKTVTRIAVDAATAGAVTAGTNGVGSSMPIPLDQYPGPHNTALAVEVTGTVNYTVQQTYDDVFSTTFLTSQTWIDHPVLANASTTLDSYYGAPPSACRLKINSGTGSARLIVRQSGISA